MNDKTEWEIVDEPSTHSQHIPGNTAQALLGRWWKWKLAGIAVVATTVLVFFATLIGVTILVLAAVATLLISIRKMIRWLSGNTAGSALTRKYMK